MGSKIPDDERMVDLLIERATRGLNDDDRVSLERMLAERPDTDEEAFELAAAQAHLGWLADDGRAVEPLPEHLGRRLVASGQKAVADRRAASPAAQPSPADRRRGEVNLGWYAAAAMLVLAAWFGWPERRPATPSPAQQRAALLEAGPDTVQVAWQPPEDSRFAGVEGDVVWNDRTQSGFLRLRGMPANDPGREQYQLWIVDPERDAHPVDGGVFDIAPGTVELVVPIDAKLAVTAPAAFAITLEQPGGVVVSGGPLLVIAPVTG